MSSRVQITVLSYAHLTFSYEMLGYCYGFMHILCYTNTYFTAFDPTNDETFYRNAAHMQLFVATYTNTQTHTHSATVMHLSLLFHPKKTHTIHALLWIDLLTIASIWTTTFEKCMRFDVSKKLNMSTVIPTLTYILSV